MTVQGKVEGPENATVASLEFLVLYKINSKLRADGQVGGLKKRTNAL
jgi:hypothetical protein